MAIVTGDRYLDALFKFVEEQSSALLDGTLVLKLNPVGLHYVQSRIEQLQELESLLAGAPVDYLRAYISDLGDHRALEQLRRILRLLTSLKVVSVLPPPARDPTPISLLPFGRLKVLELRGCDLSTSAARGLLELRHTLEKLICHNSTDALRHVFASRIMDIKESPTWHKLAFVSCACNGLVLMDESLQLLPSVETLDLSRNRFAKVDNLRRCTKLRHLDLGFNHIRSVASLSEVSYHHIVKLVLRNNALTTLRGIENLTSIEGLDLSYNIISNFSELEFLGSLVSLKNLWLEGNPICCARWYRPQVFSYFSRPQELSLDEKEISTRETWKRQIILASRQKQPPGYGFYSPAKVESEQGSTSTRRKMSRLAFIEEEHKSFFGSDIVDLESVSCDSVYMRREENSDGEAEIASLMNKIECMKKERSVLWLRELKEWIDQTPGDRTEDSKLPGFQLINEKYRKSWRGYKLPGENSSYAPDLVQDSGDESSTNFIESDTSFTDSNIGFSGRDYIECSSKAIFESPVFDGIPEVKPAIKQDRMDSGHKNLKATQEELSLLPFPYTLSGQGGDGTEKIVSMKSLTAIDEIMESRSSSIHPGSPPHYQEDILHRRHNWEEEFLQFSAESFSLPSSDSDTSCDDDSCKICTPVPGVDQTLTMESTNGVGNDQYALPPDEGDVGLDESDIRENGSVMLHCSAEQSSTVEVSKPDAITPFFMDKYVSGVGGSIINGIHCQDVNCVERKRGKKKPKKRVVSLSEENLGQHNDELPPQARNVVLESDEGSGDEGLKHYSRNDFWNLLDRGEEQALTDEFKNLSMHCVGNSDMANSCAASAMDLDEIIKNYFDENAADAGVPETCLQCIVCHCILQQESGYVEKEVALVRSSAGKLYVLLVDASFSGRGNKSKVLGCHRLEDIKEVVFGIGLQILRLYIEGSISYLFITRNIEKSRGLLSLLQVSDSSETSSGCRCSIRSWEQVQIRLFEDSIRGGMKMSIFQYSMLLFWHNRRDGESWLSRSLFVIAEHVLVCSEDILQFCAGVDDLCLSSPYFSLDSCCSICSISEMVIESKENKCLTMSLDGSESSKVGFLSENEKKKQLGHATSSPLTWKLKWFSEDAIFKFVALIKAIHLATTMSSLPIKCIS